MWDAFLTVCTIVGMFAVYTVVIGSLLIWVLRAIKRRHARIAGRVAPGAPMGIDRRARSWDELPEWVSQEHEWAAAIVVLGSPSIAERTAKHVDFTDRRVDWEGLRTACLEWDDHARNLVEVADALAHPEGLKTQGAFHAPGASTPA